MNILTSRLASGFTMSLFTYKITSHNSQACMWMCGCGLGKGLEIVLLAWCGH